MFLQSYLKSDRSSTSGAFIWEKGAMSTPPTPTPNYLKTELKAAGASCTEYIQNKAKREIPPIES